MVRIHGVHFFLLGREGREDVGADTVVEDVIAGTMGSDISVLRRKKERDGGELRTGERGSGGRFIIFLGKMSNKFVERCPSGTGHLVGPWVSSTTRTYTYRHVLCT